VRAAPLRVKVEELGRRVVRLLCGPLFRLLPLRAAELVQRRLLRRRAAVTTDEVQVGDGNVQLRVVGVDELQELRGPLAKVHRHEPEISADAVQLVDHGIADAHFGQVAQHRVDVRATRGIALVAAHDAGIELGLGDERELRLRPREARMERRDDQRLPAGGDLAPVVGERHLQPYSAKYCCIVSRRPGLSAQITTRASVDDR
jgi:hypothetical protein